MKLILLPRGSDEGMDKFASDHAKDHTSLETASSVKVDTESLVSGGRVAITASNVEQVGKPIAKEELSYCDQQEETIMNTVIDMDDSSSVGSEFPEDLQDGDEYTNFKAMNKKLGRRDDNTVDDVCDEFEHAKHYWSTDISPNIGTRSHREHAKHYWSTDIYISPNVRTRSREEPLLFEDQKGFGLTLPPTKKQKHAASEEESTATESTTTTSSSSASQVSDRGNDGMGRWVVYYCKSTGWMAQA